MTRNLKNSSYLPLESEVSANLTSKTEDYKFVFTSSRMTFSSPPSASATLLNSFALQNDIKILTS